MANKASPSQSRIPLPVHHSPSPGPVNGKHITRIPVESPSPKHKDSSFLVSRQENGLFGAKPSPGSVKKADAVQKGKGFETFVMTGDMIIKTTPPHQKSRLSENGKSGIPKSTMGPRSPELKEKFEQEQTATVLRSPKVTYSPKPSHIPMSKSMKKAATVPPASVVSLEELTDASHSSSGSESSTCENLEAAGKVGGGECGLGQVSPEMPNLGSAMDNGGKTEPPPQETPSSGDSGVLQDSSDSDSGDKTSPGDQVSGEKDRDGKRTIVCSKSAEKIIIGHSSESRSLVRPSKSHENYLEHGVEFALVDIDIDDNMAYSLDTLTYHEGLNGSEDKVSDSGQSRSLHSSPERKVDKKDDRIFMPGFINLEEPRQQKRPSDGSDASSPPPAESQNVNANALEATPGRLVASKSAACQTPGNNDLREDHRLYGCAGSGLSSHFPSPAKGPGGSPQKGNISSTSDDQEFSDSESLYHQPSKGVDRPSAQRLAKRLFYLDGFRKSDVSRHLSKKNEFSNLVAEEYLKFFDMRGDTLDAALRKFLKQFSLTGETQERERVLVHFSHHYLECNPGAFKSEDACHTLTCAIMLLNTDLHGQAVGRKMTCSEFIENLAELNDGENFPKDVLKAIYHSIKTEPLEWAVDDDGPEVEASGDDKLMTQGLGLAPPASAGHNPFLDVPDPNKTTEYKKGYVMRKCCMDADRRRTPLGKRGWKMFYAVLRDMILYLYKDEHQLKKGSFVESTHNAIRIHHAIATKATDYTKKQHVFRLTTADGAECLFQTSDSKELQEWMDTINFVAASLSSPPLSGAVGSQARFQRPLMPIAYTRYNLREQLCHHEERVRMLEAELHLHQSNAPEKGAKSRVINDYIEKENYLEFELKRMKLYVYMLQSKLAAFPELEPSLAETAIGEDEETLAVASTSPAKPVQRSLSDRTSSGSDSAAEDEDNLHINEETINTYL